MCYLYLIRVLLNAHAVLSLMRPWVFFSYTAVFEKVYRTIFESKRRRLVFKTGVVMYSRKYLKSVYLHIFIFVKNKNKI